ncbi:MAG: bifunctional phosphopantothenoylcysteine decarboxylase/phosphopantothenate--cysteine ligase CoaBC [Gammaproteobacteria bacterium]|nr:MAG: bifunctional phosphopantothenoylcysteine decarboxylase/phosphopantothenate--cysteine ligase CoaBC [Gammaproteobacteria bacterium]
MDSPRPARILLGVTGGIAAYKSPDLVRRLRERGAEVQVVMTRGAANFITPLTLQAVSGRPVRDTLWDGSAEAAMDHIELARWADAVLVAPATADFLARLAHGHADDLLSTLCLATAAPLAVAPAMNRLMWGNAATRANVALLESRGVAIFGPGTGEQACGETGEGRMLEPAELAELLLARLPRERVLAGLKVVITAGPTRELIDPVRFISNRSSGKMGYAVACAARDAGAEVVLVSGPVALPAPAGVQRVCVESAEQMYEAVHAALPGADIYIGTAAVADYRPVAVAPQKIKKTAENLRVELVRAPDILGSVAALRQGRPFVVGFAAETENLEEHARRKLLGKRLDMIAANRVGDGLAFDRDDNSLLVLWNGGREDLGAGGKPELARRLVALIGAVRCSVRQAPADTAAGES